jgi:radical SAM superfamily enzyme with C-terminal helix-hairpin-helix motif
MRSITALPVPLRVNTLPASAIRWLPGMGKMKLASVIAQRPFKDLAGYRKVAGSSVLDPLIEFT